MELNKEDLERLYYFLLLTRNLDDRLRKLFRQGRFEGTYFSAIGQEATTVVPTYLLKKDDFIALRPAKGIDPFYVRKLLNKKLNKSVKKFQIITKKI